MCFNTRRSYASENVKFQSWIYLTTTFILFCKKKKKKLHLYCKIFLIQVYDSNVCWRFLKKKNVCWRLATEFGSQIFIKVQKETYSTN